MNRLIVFAAFLGALLVICLLSRVVFGRPPTLGGGAASPQQAASETAGRMLRAARKWNTAATQDKNDLLALMHHGHAKAYLHAVRDMMPDGEIARVYSVDAKKLLQSIEKTEQKLYRRIAQKSPGLVPKGETNVKTGWL